MSESTTDAIKGVVKTLRKDMNGLLDRLSSLERGDIGTRTPTGNARADSSRASESIGQGEDEGSPVGPETEVEAPRRLTPMERGREHSYRHERNATKVIRDWNLKFDGGPKSIYVEPFLFRIETF